MKKFKFGRLPALLLALLLCFSMTACGVNINIITEEKHSSTDSNKLKKAEKGTSQTASGDLDDPDPDFAKKTVAESGDFGNYHFEIIGAEFVEDDFDAKGIRLWYDFSNNSKKETQSASYCTVVKAYQDGEELGTAYVDDDDYMTYGNYQYDYIRPGITVRCLEDFEYNEDGGPIRFEINNWYGGDENEIVTAIYSLDELPGGPTKEFELQTVENPTWTNDLDWEGDKDDVHVVIDSAEPAEGYSGESVIRVYVDITNNGKETITPLDILYLLAYQDGVQLNSGLAKDDVEEDDNYDQKIRKGKTLRVAYTFELRSDSPVEVEGELGFDDDSLIGGVFQVNE